MTYEMIEAEDAQPGQRLREANDAVILTVGPSGAGWRYVYITLEGGRSAMFHKHDMIYVQSDLSAIQETP